MKKVMMVTALLALMLAVAVPAIAQVNNGIGQQTESGTVTGNFSANQTGSNSSQCVTPQQFGNTGSSQNAQPILQYNSVVDGALGNIEPQGSELTISPQLSGGCTQYVQQSAAASGGPSDPSPADPPPSKGAGKRHQ